jgi:hypothetical protein
MGFLAVNVPAGFFRQSDFATCMNRAVSSGPAGKTLHPHCRIRITGTVDAIHFTVAVGCATIVRLPTDTESKRNGRQWCIFSKGSTMNKLWKDDAAFVVSADLVLVSSILVLGLMVGLASLRDQIVQELGDVGAAIAVLQQSYTWSGVTGHTASMAGSGLTDVLDFCDEPPLPEFGSLGIDVLNEAEPEGT